jgi:hypothetical protein
MNTRPRFLTVCTMTPLEDGRNWRLDQPLAYAPADGGHITVQSGFTTDLASIPRLFWNILPPFGRYTEAAVVHDFLYRTHTVTRKRADSLFYEMMTVLGVNPTAKWTIYLAVRWFGGKAYRDDRRFFRPKLFGNRK